MFAHTHPTETVAHGQLSVNPDSPVPALGWREIVAIEPDVAAVIAEARAIKSPSWLNYSLFKGSLLNFVGYGAKHPRLQSPVAYDIAIRKLVEALRL